MQGVGGCGSESDSVGEQLPARGRSRAFRALQAVALGVSVLAAGLTFGLETSVPANATVTAPATAPSSWYGSGNFFASDHSGVYWMANAAGAVSALSGASSDGSLAGTRLNKPIVGIAGTPDGGGYWMGASDGGSVSFGAADLYGATGS